MKGDNGMKGIKDMGSKDGFYMGRLREVRGNGVNDWKVWGELNGVRGRGMGFWRFLMRLGGNEKGIKVIDGKGNLHKHLQKW